MGTLSLVQFPHRKGWGKSYHIVCPYQRTTMYHSLTKDLLLACVSLVSVVNTATVGFASLENNIRPYITTQW